MTVAVGVVAPSNTNWSVIAGVVLVGVQLVATV